MLCLGFAVKIESVVFSHQVGARLITLPGLLTSCYDLKQTLRGPLARKRSQTAFLETYQVKHRIDS
jgi:hypothetical protein